MAERRKTPLSEPVPEPHACTPAFRLDILARVPFFAGLTERDLEVVNRRFRERGFEPGDVIYSAGDPASTLYVMAAGKVKLLRHTLEGKDILLDFLAMGEYFGSLASLGDDEYPDTAQAQTAVCTLSIGSDDFRKILETYPRVTLQVLDVASRRLKDAHERVRQLSAYSVEQRIAYTLLMLAEKLGEPQELGLLIQIPLSRDDLSGMVGATTETVSRVMSQFQKEGWIQTGRQWVAITDRGGLEALANQEWGDWG